MLVTHCGLLPVFTPRSQISSFNIYQNIYIHTHCKVNWHYDLLIYYAVYKTAWHLGIYRAGGEGVLPKFYKKNSHKCNILVGYFNCQSFFAGKFQNCMSILIFSVMCDIKFKNHMIACLRNKHNINSTRKCIICLHN